MQGMIDGLARARRWFRVQAIGTVRRPEAETAPGEFLDPWSESVLEIEPRWAAGLDGIEGFSHLVVLFYLDRAPRRRAVGRPRRSEEHTSELQSQSNLVCRLLLEKKKKIKVLL